MNHDDIYPAGGRFTALRWISALALVAWLPSCGDDPVGTGETPAAVTMSDTVITLASGGQTFELIAEATDAAGQTINASVTWTSLQPQTVTVTDGLIRSVDAGEAIITASVEGVEARARVTVFPSDQSFSAYVSSFDSGRILMIDVATNTIVDTLSVAAPGQVAITPSRSFAYVAVSGSDPGLTAIDLRTSIVIDHIRAPIVDDIAITGDSFKAFLTHGQFSISTIILDNHTGFTTPFRVRLLKMSLTPDNSIALATVVDSLGVGVEPFIPVIDIEASIIQDSIDVGDTPSAIAIMGNGAFAYVPNKGSDNVTVISLATNGIAATIPVGVEPIAIAITRSGSVAYVANLDDISVIDIATNTVISTIPVGAGAVSIAFTRDGSKAYIARPDADEVVVVDVATHTVTTTISVGDPRHIGIR